MCDDVRALIEDRRAAKVACSPIHEERWGSITHVTLPGGGKLGINEPKHASSLQSPKKAT